MDEIQSYNTLFENLKNDYEAFGICQIVSDYNNLVCLDYRTDKENFKIRELQKHLKWWNDERVDAVDQAYRRLIEKGIDGIKSPEKYLITPQR